MSKNPPISFEALAKQANSAKAGGYPYQLKGKDLDQNFVFATLQIDESLVTSTTGSGGHAARKLKIPGLSGGSDDLALVANGGALSWKSIIPKAPNSGTFVLGAVDGVVQWIETEECA